jgi:hypothetical protein
MTDDVDNNKVLIRKLNLQEKQIEHLRAKVFTLQEALIRSNVPTCGLNHSLAPISPIISRVFPDARTTVIAFGGMITRLGMPPAEFLKTFIAKNINTFFLKDFHQCWYQQGLLGLSNNATDTVELIKKQIPSHQEKIYTVGTSAGGFAAIFFGILLGVDKIIAFGPQTIVTKPLFQKFKGLDSRITDINFGDELLDLKKLLETTQYNGSIHIHYAINNRIDKIAAERLKDFKNVHLHPWETDSHNVAGWLKKEKKLDSILSELFPVNSL